MSEKFSVAPRRWYAWQTTPGDDEAAGLRPCTPFFITGVMPLKTGKGVLRLSGIAALYPTAARHLRVDLRVALHQPDHLVGTFVDASGRVQTAIVREVDFRWLTLYCPEFWYRFPPSRFVLHEMGFSTKVDDAQTYLRAAFGADEDRVLRGATEASFKSKLQKMPKQSLTLRLDRPFSEFDSILLRRGFVPRQMEDKWFIYCKDDRLLMRRSWTGMLIYEVSLEEHGAAVVATEARVNRNPKQYGCTDDDHDRRMVHWLIDTLLLGIPSDFPSSQGLSPEQQAIEAWAVAGKASRS